MAKRKIFGNRKEPRCETCALGKLSSDGSAVLCEYSGAMPLDHSCRRYRYDPLRRTPRRMPAPDAPDAAAFSLDDAAVTDTHGDTYHSRMMGELRTYLDETAEPDVDTILAILHADTKDDDTAALLEEAARMAVGGTVSSPLGDEEGFIPDDSDDILDDLARIGKPPTGSVRASLDDAPLRLADESDTPVDTELPLDGDQLVLTASDEPDAEPPLDPAALVLAVAPDAPTDPAYDEPVDIPDEALRILTDDVDDSEYDAPPLPPDEALAILDDEDDE